MKKQLLGGLLVAMTFITACGSNDESSSPTSTEGGDKIQVVAAENFYGDMASKIGGDRVEVTSILNGQDVDPHSYEPGTEASLAIANADLVIENGLDYDHFMEDLVSASPNDDREVLTMSDVVGAEGNANPHLWYDVTHLGDMTAAIADSLTQADPEGEATFTANREAFDASLQPLMASVMDIKANHSGEGVMATEPVAGYLIEAAGLDDKTPPAFAQAIEEESDPSAAALSEFLAQLRSGDVKVLIYNDQTTSNITTQVREAAEAAGVKVVGVTETMEPNASFVQWQTDQVKELQAAFA